MSAPFQAIEELPPGLGRCMVCEAEVEQVALVGYTDPPTIGIGSLQFQKMSEAVLIVGPCGHSTHDCEDGEPLYVWDARL